MTSEFIEERNGGYYVAGTRISLDSVVYAYLRGGSAEHVQSEFPLLELGEIRGAIAFYLDHKEAIDRYLEEGEREFEASGVPLSQANPELWDRLQRARRNGSPR